MKKIFGKVLAATFLACTCVSAVAQTKAPTLADVLKASDLSVTGYIDTSYTYLTGSGTFAGTTNFNRVYDRERRGFNLHTVDFSVAYQPASGFGAFVQVDLGTDADVSAAAGSGAADNTDVQEAYLQWTSGPLTVIGGKFATLAGAEVIESPSNLNFSRGILFGYAIPFTHTGVRATIAPTDQLKFIAGINNGWDVLKETATVPVANGKTIELGVSATPLKELTLNAAYYFGDDAGGAAVGERDVLDLVALYNLSDALSFAFNYDRGAQDNALAGGGTAKWDGIAAFVNYKLNDLWRVAFRVESFDDKHGFRTGVAQVWKETTATVAYTPAKAVELRGEVRFDKSNQSSFDEPDGTPDKKQHSVGLEAIYKF